LTGQNRSRRATSLAAGIGICVLLAACSPAVEDDSGSPTTPSAGSPSQPGQPGQTVAPNAEPEFVAPPLGPLDEVMTQIWGPLWGATDNPQAAQEQLERDHRAQQEYIAACMAEQGFTYYPAVATMPTVLWNPGPTPGSREFAQQFGLGISADPWDLPGAQGQGSGQSPAEANAEILAVMSEAELAAWWEAFSGAWVVWVMDGRIGDEPDNEDLGCSGRAQRMTLPPQDVAEFGAIEAEVARFGDSLAIHPAIIALNTEWAVCLANVGYPGFANPDQLRAGLLTEWRVINDLLMADDAARLALLQDWNWDAAPAGPPGWTTDADSQGYWLDTDLDTAAAIATFRDREFALALADVDCRESVDFDARRRDIVFGLQQEFVAANRNELDAWIEYAASRRAAS